MAKDKPHEPALGGSYAVDKDGARRRVAFTEEAPAPAAPSSEAAPIDAAPAPAPKPAAKNAKNAKKE